MKKSLNKIFKYSLLFLVIGTIASFLWIDNELAKILGKTTEVINISSFIKPVSTIQIKNVAILSEDCANFIENQMNVRNHS